MVSNRRSHSALRTVRSEPVEALLLTTQPSGRLRPNAVSRYQIGRKKDLQPLSVKRWQLLKNEHEKPPQRRFGWAEAARPGQYGVMYQQALPPV